MKYLKKYENLENEFNAIKIAGEITEKVSKDEFFEMVKEEQKKLSDKKGQAQTELASESVIIELISNYKNGEEPFEENQKMIIYADQEAKLENELKGHYLGPDVEQPLN